MLITYQARPPVDLPAKQAEHTAPGWSGALRAKPRVCDPKFYGPLKAVERTSQAPTRIFNRNSAPNSEILFCLSN